MRFLRRYGYELAIAAVVLLIFFTNYTPGTFLTGWDNLQTELNPWLAVKRSFFAVWQEYQSFGLVSGLAHGADLVRAVFMYLVSFLLPQSVQRYFFHLLMLALGGLGIMRLLEHLGLNNNKKYAAFLGALLYMLNLGTVQEFSLPWEAFSTFFAFLPWEIWIFLRSLQHPESKVDGRSSKTLLLLAIINLLATPQAYVQTIFLVYMMILGLIFAGLAFHHRTRAFFSRSFLVFFIIFTVNSFWLLPQLYFVRTSGYIVKEAKANQLSTEDTVFLNKEKGDLNAFAKFEGFYYETIDSSQNFVFLNWKKHFDNPVFIALPYLIFTISIIGLRASRKHAHIILPPLILTTIALLNATPPVSYLNDIIRMNEFINQIFRSPFTKFIVPHVLFFSILFAFSIDAITRKISDHRSQITDQITVVVALLILLYSLPAFQGSFFAPLVRVPIPNSYMQLIDYFKLQDLNKRVALLPDYTFWGWFHNRWNYDGSGFLWYGIEQPIVSRTFDVWSDKSESYFWEMKTAWEAEDQAAVERTIEKYNIDYLVLDTSLLPVSSTLKGMQYNRITDLLKKSKKVALVEQFGGIMVYQVSHEKPVTSFVSVMKDLPNIGPEIKLTNSDNAYQSYGEYKTIAEKPFHAYFPFLDLTSQTRINDKHWNIDEQGSQLVLSAQLPQSVIPYRLSASSTLTESSFFKNNDAITYDNFISTQVHDATVSVTFKRLPVFYPNVSDAQVTNCSYKGNELSLNGTPQSLRVTSADGAAGCFGFDAPFLDQRYGYLLKLGNRNIEGRRLFLYVLDKTKTQSYIEDRLTDDNSFYLINPKYQYGLGYSFNFQNTSYKNTTTINELSGMNVFLFPYNSVKTLQLTAPTSVPHATIIPTEAHKNLYFWYTVEVPKTQNATIILHQSFHPGWHAYVNGVELKNHYTVNNWANGWDLDLRSQISDVNSVTIIFIPQYLQFFGYAFCLVMLTLLLRNALRSKV